MTYDVIFNSIQTAYDWLFGVYFPRIFAFLKNNELVSAALIISFVLPTLFIIVDFYLHVSSDAELYSSKLIKNEQLKVRRKELNEQRKQIYYNRNNSYHQAYLNSLKYDKKNDINK